MNADADDEKYFSGRELRGDDFTPEQIAEWFELEREGYADLVKAVYTHAQDDYGYDAFNQRHSFRFLPEGMKFPHILGFGSANGLEIKPIADRAERITIVDPSDAFATKEIRGVPVTYKKPRPDGVLPLGDAEVDLVTCYGVLHHIPNVTAVFTELLRVLKPGGYMFVREPMISMGDWRKPRQGLTKNERGLPLPWMRALIAKTNCEVIYEGLAAGVWLPRMIRLLNRPLYDSPTAVAIDAFLSRLTAFNYSYYAEGLLGKLRPGMFSYVLRKPSPAAGK